ncbi:unnamed protein product, partial [Dicrocoelium dendriticum]
VTACTFRLIYRLYSFPNTPKFIHFILRITTSYVWRSIQSSHYAHAIHTSPGQ